MRLLARISLSVDLLLGVLMLFSCTPQESSVATVASISVNPSSLTIAQGSRQPLSVSVQPAGAKYLYVSWSSSDPEVARVNKAGTLTAIKEGSATITAAIGEVTGTCRVTVAKNLTPVDKVLLSATSMTLGKGSSQTLTATVEPENAADKTIVWSSTDTGVATVSGGEVVAVGAGTCEIVAASASGTAEARCSVTVADIPVEALAFAGDSGLTQIVSAGSDYTLIVSYSPATTSDREILWKCSNPDMATVSEQGQGQATVTFATSAAGAVTVTATSAANASCSASRQFFVRGDSELVLLPEETLYAGRKALWRFNTQAYPDATHIIWNLAGCSYTGPEASFAAEQGGENTMTVTATVGDVPISFALDFQVQEWYLNEIIPGANPRNTYPVFNKGATRAYFVTRGERRLYEINLEEGRLGWMFDMNDGKNDNGGDICVNPLSGDIYCSNQMHVFCLAEDGHKRWQIDVPTGGSASSLAGCGPGMSNDCKVVFMPLTDKRFVAVDAATGTILDSFGTETAHLQFAVYGDNNIVLTHSASGGTNAIKFVGFSGGKFSEVTAIDSPSADPTDITSPAVSPDQKKAWFPCNGGLMVEVDLEARSARASAELGGGYLQGACLLPSSGWMFFASQQKARVSRVQASAVASGAQSMVCYTNGSDNYLNFTTVACDTEGNVYFFIKEDGTGNSVFYRLAAEGSRWQPEPLAVIAKQNNDPQGFFNFAGGYLIGGGGNNSRNQLLVRCLDAQRAPGWSGPGGDACATKNANIAYGL